MSPRTLTKLTVREAARCAVPTLLTMVIPNDIRIEVGDADYDSWGPVAGLVEQDVLRALDQFVADHEEYSMPAGGVRVHVTRNPVRAAHNPRLSMRLVSPAPTALALSSQPPRRATPRMAAPAPTTGGPTTHRPSRETQVHPDDGVAGSGSPTIRICEMVVRLGSGRWTSVLCEEGVYVFGRGIDCDVRLEHAEVSERHFELVVARHGVTARDLRSTNGTIVRGVGGAETPTALLDGDVVLLSEHVQLEVLRGGGRPRGSSRRQASRWRMPSSSARLNRS